MKQCLYIKLILTTFMMTFFCCKGQIVVDKTSNIVLPSNYNETGQYYEKDIHNYLLPFVGTWEYVNGNKKFQIILTKITKYHYQSSKLNLNFYEDGISLQYKKFENGNLIFQSPITNVPTLTAYENTKLEGYIVDYERMTVDVPYPSTPLAPQGLMEKGGDYFHPICEIEKLPLNLNTNDPPQIKFNMYTRENNGKYRNPIYNGQPFFSIPNDVILTKVP